MTTYAQPPTGSLVVFAGPSISSTEVASRLPQAHVRGPAQRGDLYGVRDDGVALIVMIDGVFAHHLAVPPSEVVDVLQDGAHVIGASSLGAVRAAECWPAGMRGIGLVFRLYRVGAISSDDEVAVVTDADCDYAARSVALINVRFAARRATRQGLIESVAALRLVRAAEAEHFSRRTWPGILAAAGLAGDGRLRDLCERTDVKRDDATAAVNHVAQDPCGPPPRPSPRQVPRRQRYPGHLLTFDLGPDEVRQALLQWLFGSARYQRYIWPLMLAEEEFDAIGLAESRPEALRESLAAALARLLREPDEFRDRLWEELDYLDELDAELERWYAVRQLARQGKNPNTAQSTAERQSLVRTRTLLAAGHGYPSWNSLTQDVVNNRLFGAIPFDWIHDAVTVMCRAQRRIHGRESRDPREVA